MNRRHFFLYVTFVTHLQKKPDNAVIAFCSATAMCYSVPRPFLLQAGSRDYSTTCKYSAKTYICIIVTLTSKSIAIAS